MSEHYFTAAPASADQRREITVTLAGRRVRVETASGVFSAERLDPGTAVLLGHGEEPPATGLFVDVGCGWGAIALDLALRSPGAEVIAVDVNERALDLTRRNAARLGAAGTRRNAARLGAAGVTAVDPGAALELVGDRPIDLLRSNPPIRVGKEALHELLATWLGRLAPTGLAELVVAKNLGADTLQRWIAGELGMDCSRAASSRGFRVLRVRPAG